MGNSQINKEYMDLFPAIQAAVKYTISIRLDDGSNYTEGLNVSLHRLLTERKVIAYRIINGDCGDESIELFKLYNENIRKVAGL